MEAASTKVATKADAAMEAALTEEAIAMEAAVMKLVKW